MLTPSDIDDVIDNILIEEGADFTNDPLDRGGATKFGVTQALADDYKHGDVRNLTHVGAVAFYRRWFADHKIDQITDVSLFHLVADSFTNHGAHGIMFLQTALLVTADGQIGPKTLSMLRISHVDQVYARTLAERFRFYAHIVHNDPSQARFINGWVNRAAGFLAPWPY